MPIGDPTDIADLRLWLRTDGLTGLSEDDPVSTWPDESGLGNDGVAPVGNEPLYKTSPAGLNGWPGLLFNEDIFNLPNLMAGAAAGEIFLVLKNDSDPPADADSGIFRFGTAGTSDHHPFADGNIYNGFGSNTRKNAGNPATNLTNLHFVNIQSAAGSWIFRIDKAAFFSTASNTVAWTTTPRVGFSISYDYRGYIVAVVLFARILTAQERSDMEDYLDRYLAAPVVNVVPDTPTASVSAVRDTEVDLSGSAYSDPDDDPHVASRWQVDFLGRDFTTPVFDSGEDTVNLSSITVEGLLPGSSYIARVAYSDGDAGFSGLSPVVTFTTTGASSSGVPNCSLFLEAFDDDGETVLWEVSTDPGHSRPYLDEPEHYGEQEIDPISGGATISQVEVVVIDRAQIQNDQASGWMTERIVEGGIGAIFGRRFRLRRFIDDDEGYVVIADGPAGTPRLDSSYSAYRWVIRDTRETERKLIAFNSASLFSFFPPGLRDAPWGFNSVDGTYLVPQADEFATGDVTDVFDVDGIVQIILTNLLPNDTPVTQAMVDASEWTLTDPGPFGGAPYGQRLNLEFRWRYAGEGAGDWRTITPGARFDIRGPFFTSNFFDPPVIGDPLARVWVNINTNDGEEAPLSGMSIEFTMSYVGPISEQYPNYIEGITTGQFIKNLYDGEYSPRDEVTGAIVPSGIRYDEDQLLLMTDPVRLRLKERIEDVRDWVESHGYGPTGWSPSFDSQLLISPVSQVPPEDFVGVTTINDTIAVPTPDWDAGERIINVLSFTYPRWYAPVDPLQSNAIDGLVERTITIEFRDDDSIRRYSEEKVEYEGLLFSAVGNEFGDQIEEEVGRSLANDRFFYVFNRYRNGAQLINIPVRRRFSSTLRAGSFVIADLSWIPDYILRRRGGVFGGQILSIKDADCAWRMMVIEEILPLAQS